MAKKIYLNTHVSLVEIIISVLIFIIAGTIILNCFLISRYTQTKAYDKTFANIKSQTIFEQIKSTKNSRDMESLLSYEFNTTYYEPKGKSIVYINYYNNKWELCNEDDSEYYIILTVKDSKIKSGEMKNINVTAKKIKPYPFSNKNKEESIEIISISSKKFFPNFII